MSDALKRAFQVGDRATWRRQPRGGYGMIEYIPVRIVALRGERASVMVLLACGGEKRVSVKQSSLRARALATPETGEAG